VAKDVLANLNKAHKTKARDVLKREPSCGEIIVHGLVKASAKDESFAEFLKRSSDYAELVGEVNVFISHAWGSSFDDTVQAIEDFEAKLPDEAPPAFYFIDYFAVNQWDAKKDLDQLGVIAQRSQKLLLMLSPWQKPATLGRAWCIFEVAHALIGSTEVVVSMPPTEKRRFQDALPRLLSRQSQVSSFLDIFTGIDSRNSKTSVEEDSIKIKKFIEEKLDGYEAVDQSVANALREWLARTVQNLCEMHRTKGKKQYTNFVWTSCLLFRALNKHGLIVHYLKQAINIFKDEGDWDSEYRAKNDLALALKNLGRYPEAIELYTQVIEEKTRKLGAMHYGTLKSMQNLGCAYQASKEWSKAEALLRTVWNDMKETQKAMSPGIRLVQGKLAEVLRDSKKDLIQAEYLFKEMLDYFTKVWGEFHHSVQYTAVEYARCLELKGSTAEALKMYMKGYPILLKAYGANDNKVKKVGGWIKALNQADEFKE